MEQNLRFKKMLESLSPNRYENGEEQNPTLSQMFTNALQRKPAEEAISEQRLAAEQAIANRDAVVQDKMRSLEPDFVGPPNKIENSPIMQEGRKAEQFLSDIIPPEVRAKERQMIEEERERRRFQELVNNVRNGQ